MIAAVADTSFGSLRQRVARHLLDLAIAQLDGRLVAAVIQQSLAEAVGSARPGDNLTRILAQRLRRTNEQLLALATLDVTGRVARQLLLLAEAYGQQEGDGIHIHLRLTQENLAQIVGASRERVNQALRQLKLQGILAVRDQHRLVLRDMEVLHAYL
jgi:CRP-like cAMP-binding protein